MQSPIWYKKRICRSRFVRAASMSILSMPSIVILTGSSCRPGKMRRRIDCLTISCSRRAGAAKPLMIWRRAARRNGRRARSPAAWLLRAIFRHLQPRRSGAGRQRRQGSSQSRYRSHHVSEFAARHAHADAEARSASAPHTSGQLAGRRIQDSAVDDHQSRAGGVARHGVDHRGAGLAVPERDEAGA